MRLEKPAGLYAFYFPYLVGLCYAACIAEPTPLTEEIFALSGLFLVGCIILRGAACTWNDNMDQDFDRKVARCRMRPIARGAVTTTQGHLFTVVLTLIGAPLFAFLPLQCAYHAMPIMILFGIYPFAKRFTHYPQLVLGFPFAWGVIISCAALKIDPFSKELVTPTTTLLLANILWTMIYDTIYAHQDIKDDVKAGVKSMAVRFANSTKLLASNLAVFQILLLLMTGWYASLSTVYFVVTCGGTTTALVVMIANVNLDQPASCAWWFQYGFWFVGGSAITGLFGEYIKRRDT